ncbi:hypothetical protein GOV11_01705 [Candidatus Woesearchaeota archaeon]|nr:hypothetical protein [Candidatus Woesearchaeota archaeon]
MAITRNIKKSLNKTLAGIALSAAIIIPNVNCGGGGGGGSPTGPTDAVISVSGNLASRGETTPSFNGCNVEIAGQTNITDGTGAFMVTGVNPSNISGEITCPDYVRKDIQFDFSNITRTSNTEMTTPISLYPREELPNLSFFNDVYRVAGNFGGTVPNGTGRWIFSPTERKMDMKSLGKLASAGPWLYNNINATFGNFPNVTNGQVGGRVPDKVNLGTTPKDCRDIPSGSIYVVGDKNLNTAGGLLGVCFDNKTNEIDRVLVIFGNGVNVGVIRQELYGVVGALSDVESSVNSLFTEPRTSNDLTSLDKEHLKYLYRTEPGSTTPDNESSTYNVNVVN